MNSKAAKNYPYQILPVDKRRIKSKVRRVEAGQFLLVETLLRTPKLIRLYKRDKQQFQSYWRDHCGIFSYDPLGGSHHSLVLPDKELERTLLEMGYVDVGLGIMDLGVIAKLPPGKTVSHGSIVLQGLADGGAAECERRLRLQGQNPRYLHLRLDASHPPNAIIESLLPLLRRRYDAIERDRKNQHPKRRRPPNEALPKAHILTRLKYFECYDLQQQGRSIREIADIVYKDKDNAIGNTNQALQRARTMIRSVQRFGQLPTKLD